LQLLVISFLVIVMEGNEVFNWSLLASSVNLTSKLSCRCCSFTAASELLIYYAVAAWALVLSMPNLQGCCHIFTFLVPLMLFVGTCILFLCTYTDYYCYYNCFTALYPGLPGWASIRRSICSHFCWSSTILY